MPVSKFRSGKIIPTDRSIPGERLRANLRRDVCHPRSQTGPRALGRGFRERPTRSEQARHDLAKIAEFAGLLPPDESTDYLRDFYPAIFEALFRSESWIAIVMITDLLGRKDRFNVPGTAANSNWTRRLPGRSQIGRAAGRQTRRCLLVRELLEKSGRV